MSESDSAMVTLEVLTAMRGDSKIKIQDNPDDRRKLAEHVSGLLKDKHAVFLELENGQTRRIKGYDPDKNEWILGPKVRKGPTERVSARGTRATSVPRVAGG